MTSNISLFMIPKKSLKHYLQSFSHALSMTILFKIFLSSLVLFIYFPSISNAQIKLGIDLLEESGFHCLKNKRVGLLTHPAGVNSKGKSTLDILWSSPLVNLTALFGPEHGIYGNENAEAKIADRIDNKTGLPVFSLYADHRRPSPKMLKCIDALVIDLQDIGVRSYTYVSCMCYTIEECFKHNIDVIVLDRPNPLGGLKVDGPIMEKKWQSYVGALPIPYVHGLTIGEIARICKIQPDWLAIPKETRENGKLTIIPMKGWERSMLWPQTGLKWIPPSPVIKDFNAAQGYAMTGLGCQIGGFRHGYATEYPFRLISHPQRKIADFQKILQKRNIPGIAFHKQSSFNTIKNEKQVGLYITITDYNAWRPTELSFHLMQLACLWSPQNPFVHEQNLKLSLFNKHVGSDAWYNAISEAGNKVNIHHFISQWTKDSKKFQDWSKQYWLY